MTTKPQSLTKDMMLEHWQGIKPGQAVNMAAIAYKHTGSTYDEDSIRITGSRPFIDSVLSRLKDLLDNENDETRLQVVYKQSQDRETQAILDSWNCYVQVHERGREAQIMNSIVRGARERIAARQGELVR